MVPAADTSMAARLAWAACGALPTLRPDLAEICGAASWRELRQFDVPMTIVHGDFRMPVEPAHRPHGGKIAAFDWEYGEVHALPLIDEIHYRLQCGWLLEEWTTQRGRLACLGQTRLTAGRWGLNRKCGGGDDLDAAYTCSIRACPAFWPSGYEDEEEVISWHRRLSAGLPGLSGRTRPRHGGGSLIASK